MQEDQERVAIFIDYPNIEAAFRQARRPLDMIELRDYLSQGRILQEAFCYVGTDPRSPATSQELIRFLRTNGFLVRTRNARFEGNGRLRCDMDVEMAVDALDFSHRARPDIVVLATGDGDFAPVASRVRMLGIRVEVAATEEILSRDLKEAASGVIDLSCTEDDEIEQEAVAPEAEV